MNGRGAPFDIAGGLPRVYDWSGCRIGVRVSQVPAVLLEAAHETNYWENRDRGSYDDRTLLASRSQIAS